jgi:Na+/H+ antiporter NhaA
MLTGVIGIVLLEIFRPDTDIGTLAARIGTLVSSLVGAIVGYIAGRNVEEKGESPNP